jgi:predicted DNA-binding antitoxin AbrB/MazE fold protein
MSTIHAVFEKGVFRPTDPVCLPENCEVEFEPRVLDSGKAASDLDDIYAILSERFQSGEADVAARHEEHQP